MAFTQDLGQGPETFFLHANARGDVVMITDENMSWAKRFSYDPWGNIISETSRSGAYEGLSCPFAYAGYFRDQETGLYCPPARYYSPSLRRFLTKDPHPGSKSNPLTLNPYQYCRNNPINRVDPTGQYDWSAFFGPRNYGDGGVAALTSAAALMQGGARMLMNLNLSGINSGLKGFRGPSFAGIFSGFVVSAQGYSSWSYGQRVLTEVQQAQNRVDSSLSRIQSAINNAMLQPQPKSKWGWGFNISLFWVWNVGYSSQTGWYTSGGASARKPISGSIYISYDPNPNNNVGGTTVRGSAYFGVGGGAAYEPQTGDIQWQFGFGTPQIGVEGDRIGD